MTTVRSSTARTRTCLPSTMALKPPLTSWLGGGTMLASETSSTVLLIECASLGLAANGRRGYRQAPSFSAAANVTRGSPVDFRTVSAPRARLRGRALLLLKPELAGRLTSAPGGFLARQVTDAQVSRVDEQAPAVDQDLRLARGRLDHGGPLEHGGDPDPAAVVDLGLEVREDLVVLVHVDAVQPDQLDLGLFLNCALAIRWHSHIPYPITSEDKPITPRIFLFLTV